MLSVFAKRPLLSALLAAGSPAVFPLRSFEYTRTIEDLLERDFQKPAIFNDLDPVILVLEYLLAAASVGNIGELCYRLGGRVLSAIFTGDEQHYFIWAWIGLAIHGFGALTLYRRTKVTTLGGEYDQHHGHTVFNQFKLQARQTRLCIEIRRESLLFLAIYWFTTLLTVCHIVYGTILFSSMLFISVEDAISVIARLMGSVIVCRIVLSYELVNLQSIVKEIKKERIADITDATAEREMEERQGSK
ncbi:hypothetical protein P152DRAFT_460138 [Eremomyces bilateralis CBS 781.70]|uniref:Uncharacterized protein n=1 Tax=Eremomyces bilateralis CBS 781.70 TaxID=1392243 RepID=A0A6G1FYC7_9PEZI|nr:uncharacterized protein P152DRAFT_460138 [Eremomyces bilateralis CBS 781.70]KAF1810847.1 hypothetical protein P152DRAFT_460138 [Eremomyces bilateralis CBS 781.70]